MGPHDSPQVRMQVDDAEMGVRWWSDYPRGKFGPLAKPQEYFNSYIDGVFSRPKKLMRSASSVGVSQIREAELGDRTRLRRSSSVSSLSPSHALPYYDRVPRRYLPTFKPERIDAARWYHGAYAPVKWNRLHHDLEKRPRTAPTDTYKPYTQYYSRLAYAPTVWTPPSMQSYVEGSERYQNAFVSSKLRQWDYALPFVHNSYEHGRAGAHAFNRHVISSTFMVTPVGLPALHRDALHKYRMYKLTGKVVY